MNTKHVKLPEDNEVLDFLFQGTEETVPAITESAKAESDNEQKTFEWHLARIDKFTGSKIGDLMKQGRGKGEQWGETAKSVIFEMFTLQNMTDEGRAEYIYQQMKKDFIQTRWGNDNESFARELYCEKTGFEVVVNGFTVNPDCEYHGGSFDGEVVGQKGIIEIKCPFDPMKHMKNVNLSRTGIDSTFEHYPQIQSNIETAKAEWCDFISFDPRQRDEYKIVIIRVMRDQFFIDAMMNRVHDAKSILDMMNNGVSIENAIKQIADYDKAISNI